MRQHAIGRHGGLTSLLAFCCLAAPALFPVPAASQPSPLAGFPDYVRAEMEAWGVPGLAIAVVEDGRMVWSSGFGVRDIRTGEPVDEHTLFAIGSASKAFTAAAMATLVDEGAVDWDDRATDALPSFRTSDPYVTRELTIRDLMSHRSGLTRGDQAWYAMDVSREEVLERVRFQPPTTSFRSTFGYNNNMFLAAGAVIERQTGRSWDEVIERRFLAPLDMSRSTTTIRDLDGLENVAQPHVELDDEVRTVPWRNVDNIGPAGSIISSVSDMSAWLRLQLGEGTLDGEEIVSEAALLETHEPHTIIDLESDWRFAAPGAHFLSYGMGWFLYDYRDRKAVVHGGNIDGMSALVGMMPEEELGVVILTNRGGTYLTYALLARVFDHYLGAPQGGMRDWSAEWAAEFAEVEAAREAQRAELEGRRVAGTSPSLSLEAYAGTYRHPMLGDLVVTLDAGALVARRSASWIGDLEHWHHDTFEIAWRDATLGTHLVIVQFDVNGDPEAIELGGERFERVPEA